MRAIPLVPGGSILKGILKPTMLLLTTNAGGASVVYSMNPSAIPVLPAMVKMKAGVPTISGPCA